MSGRDYSQLGEQQLILQWAASQPSVGSFLDLGCYDGETYSNTAALADLGWSGVCVDASPDAVAACALRYADRPDVSVVCGAFTLDEAATAVIHWVPQTMYSSLRPSRRTDITLVPIEVARLDLGLLADRVARMPRPLFCSIDLEGMSLDALSWVLSVADPGCVCVEANTPAERAAARELLGGWREQQMPRNHSNLLFARAAVAA